MGIDVLRNQLIDRIKNGDEQLIRVMHAVSEALDVPEEITDEMITSIPAPSQEKLTAVQLRSELEEANAEIERGEFVTLEDLEKETEQW